jgi:hypothetical protein
MRPHPPRTAARLLAQAVLAVAPVVTAVTIVAAAGPAVAAPPPDHAPTVFAPAWDALVGRWLGAADADAPRDAPVPSSGAATFDYELDGRVLTRRHVTDLPAAHGRPALHHEDLMTIYPAPDGRNAEAMYYDSEGHVVHYAATWSTDERTLVFLAFPEEGTPRLKLTWHFDDVDTLAQVVEVAPPGGVVFRRFDGGTLHRVGIGEGPASK